MTDSTSSMLLADIVLIVHVAVVLFIVGGLVLIVIGNQLAWSWVNSWWFRVSHLLAIAMVVVESWLGIACPLTVLEWQLRANTGLTPTSDSFIAYWLRRILFYDAPPWAFLVAYTLFGVLVIVAWRVYPPVRRHKLPIQGRTPPM
ncbi:DUF2784 domain-containing protein [Chitinivorax sp. B]|uniref:DUF2784 domain-containing protein n=1 Tax=Chitinivorax sp. B TaxID=2502235 RepID=UPI0010FA09A2|nr:DUF2784 domain-containing protein [Chitinivorax sp. B]